MIDKLVNAINTHSEDTYSIKEQGNLMVLEINDYAILKLLRLEMEAYLTGVLRGMATRKRSTVFVERSIVENVIEDLRNYADMAAHRFDVSEVLYTAEELEAILNG